MGHRLTSNNAATAAALSFRGTSPAGAFKSLACLLFLCVFTISALLPCQAMAWGEFTLKDEKELGDKFNVLVRSRLPLVSDTEVTDYIESIVQRLSKSLPPQPFPFTPSVIRHNALNAFATPGGYIFVHTGLLLSMEHESEVAGVIAHEMAHVTQRHIAGRVEQSQWVNILSVLGAVAGAFIGGEGGNAAMIGSLAAGHASMLSYSRGDEAEADQVGMSYLVKAGYPPSGMAGAFEIMGRKQWIMGTTIPTYLSTHPGVLDRARDMHMRAQNQPASVQNRKDDDVKFLRIQALVRARYSDPGPATQIFNQQMSGPNRCMALMGMGILSARQNGVNDASNFFEQALSCSPGDQLILREAGRFHYTKGNRDLGADYLAQAVALNRKDVMALFYYARSLGDSGQPAAAVEYLHEVQRIVPDDSEVHEFLARYYAAMGKLFEANLHMAYSALYSINKSKIEQFQKKVQAMAKTESEKMKLERFEKEYEDRKQYW